MNKSDQSKSQCCKATHRPDASAAATTLTHVERTQESTGMFLLAPRIAEARWSLGRSNSHGQRRVAR